MMEYILPKKYEEVLERNFEEEVLILKDDQLISILLSIKENDKIKTDDIQEKSPNMDFLINNGYVKKESEYFFLTKKAANYLNILGIPTNYVKIENLIADDAKKSQLYNFQDLLKIPRIDILKSFSIGEMMSNGFLVFNSIETSLECTLFLNCVPYVNEFLIKLKSHLELNTKVVFYYNTVSQRRSYLTKNYGILTKTIFPIIDFYRNRLKLRNIKKGALKSSLLYNSKYSKAEILGRITYSGYKLIEEIDGPDYNKIIVRPSELKETPEVSEIKYSNLIKLPRIGRFNKVIYVYKFRTMYPYSEYITDYVYQTYNFRAGGLFEADIRISKKGNFLRKIWLDELPMIINIIKGDLKLIGVRALSKYYLELYPMDLRQLRSQYKPGLIPPFYVDLPNDLDGIFISEKKYLERYRIKPCLTDFEYFLKSIYRVFFHKTKK
jgi:lipopolysaccharide/colanic/teichoic acid biosynthesis glycosyltransferase